MSVIWQQGRMADGQNWLSARGEGEMPCIVWRDTDPPERFRALAEQARDMATMEAEQAQRFARSAAIHERQVEAYTAIAEVLESGKPTSASSVESINVTVEGK